MKGVIDRSMLETIFDSAWSAEELPNHAELREKFVFHLQDALPDLVKFAGLVESEEEPPVDVLEQALYDLFLHTVPHLVAAGQIYDVIPQTFPEQQGIDHSEAPEPSPSTSH